MTNLATLKRARGLPLAKVGLVVRVLPIHLVTSAGSIYQYMSGVWKSPCWPQLKAPPPKVLGKNFKLQSASSTELIVALTFVFAKGWEQGIPPLPVPLPLSQSWHLAQVQDCQPCHCFLVLLWVCLFWCAGLSTSWWKCEHSKGGCVGSFSLHVRSCLLKSL